MSHLSSRKESLGFCIVWSPLPPITWIFPFIGHLGICDSQGVASDFRGPYYVGDDGQMAFGAPTRALYIPFEEDPDLWDSCIQEANEIYRGRMHNICCDNCHSHVANSLNRMNVKAYGVRGNWDMVKLAALLFFKGRFLNGFQSVYAQFGPFLILVLALVLTVTLTKT